VSDVNAKLIVAGRTYPLKGVRKGQPETLNYVMAIDVRAASKPGGAHMDTKASNGIDHLFQSASK